MFAWPPTASLPSLLKIYMNTSGQTTYIFEHLCESRLPLYYRFWMSVWKTATSFSSLTDVNIDAGCRWTSIFDRLLGGRRPCSAHPWSNAWRLVGVTYSRKADFCHRWDGELQHWIRYTTLYFVTTMHGRQLIFLSMSWKSRHKDINKSQRVSFNVTRCSIIVKLSHFAD